jgi:hypothetical protein
VVVPPPGAVEGDGVPVVGCANVGVVANIGKLMAVAKTTIANIVGCVTFTMSGYWHRMGSSILAERRTRPYLL